MPQGAIDFRGPGDVAREIEPLWMVHWKFARLAITSGAALWPRQAWQPTVRLVGPRTVRRECDWFQLRRPTILK